MNKNFTSKLPLSSQTYGEVVVEQNSQRISVSLVGDTPIRVEKYSRLLIEDLDRLFHITVNPPPDLAITLPDDDTDKTILTCRTLQSQWKYVTDLLSDRLNLCSLYTWFDDFVIVPERTKDGLIHFHCIARLNENRIDTDIPRLFWNYFQIEQSFKPSTSSGLKRFKEVIKYMVNIEPINSAGIIDYLFHKDKKDYESLMHIKVNDYYPFKPIRLCSLNIY